MNLLHPSILGSYLTHNASLYLGDSFQIMDLMEPVDHIISDPPYSKLVHECGSRTGSKSGGDPSVRKDLGFDYLTDDQVCEASRQFVRLSRGWIVVFSDLESIARWRAALTQAGAKYKVAGVWIRGNTAPRFNGDSPAAGAEAINIAWAGKGRSSWNGGGRPAVWECPIVLNRGDDESRVHTTQKPLTLMEMLIKDFTQVNQVILDPFMGSGTTGRAALSWDRKFMGIEQKIEYFEIASQRCTGVQTTMPFAPSKKVMARQVAMTWDKPGIEGL